MMWLFRDLWLLPGTFWLLPTVLTVAQQASRCEAGTARYRNEALDSGNRHLAGLSRYKIAGQALMLM